MPNSSNHVLAAAMKRICGALLVTFAVCAVAHCLAMGDDQTLAFIRGLQEKGYADVAVEYLNWLKQQPKMPEAVADVFDLEMSKSLRGAAASAFDAKDAERMKTEAQKHLDKFLKEKPDHPEYVAATVSWANFAVDQALQQLRAAQATADKGQQAKLMAEARALLEQARPRYLKAVERYRAHLAAAVSSQPAKASKAGRTRPDSKLSRAEAARRAQLEIDWVDAHFRVGLLDYYVGQTYTDPKADERIKALKSAAEIFDNIWQAYRVNAQGQVSLIGLTAHMWHGKTMEDLGDLRTAEDIYDEVLANADTGAGAAQTGMEPLFAQVAYFRMMIYKRKAQLADFVSEGRAWLAQFKNYARTDGYQGITLETAKAMLELARQGGPDKAKLTQDAREMLTRNSKIPSQYQQGIIMALRGLVKAVAAKPEDIRVFDEAVALGNQSAEGKQWSEAAGYFERAVQIAEDPKVPILKREQRLAEAREAWATSAYRAAYELFDKDKYEESLELASRVVRESKKSAVAAPAAELAVRAAFALYANAPADKKDSARNRLRNYAKGTIDTWPDKPEADGARLLLGQLHWSEGNVQEALKAFENVNPKSERYPVALHMAGHAYWVRYLLEKQKGALGNKEQMEADRQTAFKRLSDSLELQRKAWEPGKPMPQQMVETQLELAEIYFERGQAKEAADLFQPLVDGVKAAKRQGFDLTTMRIFMGAVRAYVSLNDLPKASDAGMVLAELGEDNPQVNAALVQFAAMLDGERRKLEQTAAKPTANPKEVEEAKARIPGLRSVLVNLLKKLSGREHLRAAAMLFVADTSSAVDLTEEAREQYDKFLARVKDDPEFAKEGAKYTTRARTQLIGLLRKQGNPQEAMKRVEELIAAFPNTLDPLVEKGLILQSWAEREPEKYQEAIDHWTLLRNRLQGTKNPAAKGRFYEVVYHLGECLVGQATKLAASDKAAAEAKAKQAEQLLKATLTLSPTLGGKTTLVGEYGVLIDKAIVLQGRTPEPKQPTTTPQAPEASK